MIEDLKRYMYQLMRRVDGLNAIVITDRDGVPVLKVANDKAPEQTLRPKFLSKASMAVDRASKLGLNGNRSIIATYSNYQIVSLNKHPWIVSMIASPSSNTGLILSLENDLQEILQDLRAAVEIS